MMPEITGIQVLESLNSSNGHNNFPVIMCSAKTDSSDVEEALHKGAIDYVKKPIDEVELLARLKTALRIKEREDQLKEMVKSKEDFLRIVAHDLRTPFSTISGFAEMLKEDNELSEAFNSEHYEFLNYIISSSNFLVEYFNKLLFWAQQDINDFKIERKNVNLLKLINASLVVYKSKSELKEIKITINIDESIEINADEVFFGQVINNLLGNAIKYTNRNGTISFTTNSSDSEVNLHIKDNGIGMSEEHIENILSNQKIKSSPGTEKEKGTGLGLRICKKILDSHNFKLNILSEQGAGTEVIIGLLLKST
jgi:signal transduction histidine kinase